MSIAAISALSSSERYEGAQTAQASSAKSSLASVLANSNTTTNTTVVTMADGASVTTKRDNAGEIVSISTTPPTRPPEVTGVKAASGVSKEGIDLLA